MELKGRTLQRHAQHRLPRIAPHAAILIAQCSDLFFSNKNSMIWCQLWFLDVQKKTEPTDFIQAMKELTDDETFGSLPIHFPHLEYS